MPMPIPSTIDFAPIVQGGNTFSVTIKMGTTVGANTNVKLDCGDHSVISPPSGSSWPYTAVVSMGSASVTVTLAANTVSSDTPVQLYVGDGGANLGNCSAWRAAGTIQVTP